MNNPRTPQRQQQQTRSTSTSSSASTATANQSPFEVFQKILLDPLSACYPDEAFETMADIREWSRSHSREEETSHASVVTPTRSRSLDSFYYNKNYSHDCEEDDSDGEEDVTLNGLLDDAMSTMTTKSHKSTKTASTYMMAREHSSTSRHSNDSSSEYGIPMLRDLPSFGAHSFASGIGGSPSRYTTVSTSHSVSEESLISEYESKLPNIKTIQKPINPVMLP